MEKGYFYFRVDSANIILEKSGLMTQNHPQTSLQFALTAA